MGGSQRAHRQDEDPRLAAHLPFPCFSLVSPPVKTGLSRDDNRKCRNNSAIWVGDNRVRYNHYIHYYYYYYYDYYYNYNHHHNHHNNNYNHHNNNYNHLNHNYNHHNHNYNHHHNLHIRIFLF